MAQIIGCSEDTRSIARPFRTSTKIPEPSLYVRLADDGHSLLLLALSGRERPPGRLNRVALDAIAANRSVFVYRQGAGKLDATGGQQWATGSNDIVDFAAQLDPFDGKPLRFDGSAKTLLFDEKILPTAGRSVLRANLSPDRRHVAALSAEGEYHTGLVFLSREGASGKRFHQVFRTADGKQVGETLMLADAPNENDDVDQCWSPDGRWVVYDDANFERVWIVPGVKQDAGDKRP